MAFQQQSWTNDDLDLIEAKLAEQSRRSFWAFRQYMHPKLKMAWWQKDAAGHLQQFYHDKVAGLRPKLLLQAPPQHGKSMMIVDFIAWASGHSPELRTIYASFSSRLGMRANADLQRMYISDKYKLTFPDLIIPERSRSISEGIYQRNSELIEYVKTGGLFRNTTVRGPITGEGLDMGVVDDPLKGREEANSAVIRDKIYDWLTDDFMTRFADDAALLGIMTRWHLDDPFGRMIDLDPSVKTIRYPALGEANDPHREIGEPLFPEHKSLVFLMDRKAAMTSANFEALYQQHPIVAGGNMFKDEWWNYYKVPPALEYRTIYADTAQKTKEQNDWSVFQCWGRTKKGQAILLDQIRGKWEAPELRVKARAFWAKHRAVVGMGTLRAFKVEDKVSGTGLIQELKREGIPMIAVQRYIDKIMRGNDASPFIESGNVLLPEEAPWLSDFLSEMAAFPNGTNDDQVDPMMDAIVDILQGSSSQPQLRAL